jgi:hypothetical protein
MQKPTTKAKLMSLPWQELIFKIPAGRLRVIERQVERYKKDPNFEPNLRNEIEEEIFRRLYVGLLE